MKKMLVLAFLLVGIILAQKNVDASSFNIQITIPNDYKITHPGEELVASIKLVNLGSSGREDVFLDYWITNPEQNIILQKKETVAVETQANFVRFFDIPEDAGIGEYYLHFKVTDFNGKESVAEHSFEVAQTHVDRQVSYWFAGILAFIVLIYIIFKSRPIIKKLQMQARVSRIVKKRLK